MGMKWRQLARVVTVALVVTSCGGSPVQSTDGPLVVSSVTPAAGSTLGGTPIRITGSNFSPTSTVALGGMPASNVVVNSSSSITAVTGPHPSGAVDVLVSSGRRSAMLPGSYTYAVPATATNAPPTIVSLIAQSSRRNEPPRFADLGEDIAVTAVIEDQETSADALTYEWTSAPGATISVTLTVIERFTTVDAAGRIVQNENRVSRDVSVRVHDSARELGGLAKNF